VAPGIVGATVQSLHALALSSSGGAIISGTLAANKATGIGPANDLAIWEGTSANDLTVMLRNGETTSTGTIATYTFLPATKIVSGATRGFGPTTGHLTAKVTYTNKATDSGIVAVSEPGAPVALASAGETAPVADAATFTAFSSPAINDSDQVAFAATLSGAVGNNSGIFAGDGSNNLRLVARKGDPNFGFVTLGDPVINDQGAIAFSATFTSGGKLLTGLFSTSSGSLRQIAQTGQQAPGCATGVTFSSFTALALDDVTRTEQQGGVVFLAALSGAGANQGLFTEDAGGNLQLLVRTGDTFNVGTAAAPVFETIASLLGTPPSASAIVAGQPWSVSPATGDVIYTATFTDKKQAIFNVVFPHS
jgi:hypothetical protein